MLDFRRVVEVETLYIGKIAFISCFDAISLLCAPYAFSFAHAKAMRRKSYAAIGFRFFKLRAAETGAACW